MFLCMSNFKKIIFVNSFKKNFFKNVPQGLLMRLVNLHIGEVTRVYHEEVRIGIG